MTINQTRYDFVILVDVKNANPNGDPHALNQPRQDMDTGKGLISDVAVKRWIREYFQNDAIHSKDKEIYFRRGSYIAETIENGSKKATEDGKKTDEEKRQWFLNKYYDNRMFGSILNIVKGHNYGQVKGAVQIGFGESIDPIQINQIGITRSCGQTPEKKVAPKKVVKKTEEFDTEDGDVEETKALAQNMGSKYVVRYGLYKITGTISGNQSILNGVTEDDVNVFFEALQNMLMEQQSASKGNSMTVQKVYVFKHVEGGPRGCAQPVHLHRLIDIKSVVDVPEKFEDYEIVVSATKKGIELTELIEGL